jgi:hypothetical protein
MMVFSLGSGYHSDCDVESACIIYALGGGGDVDSCSIKVHCFQVSGKDPGYGMTSVIVLLSAITILRESGKMPGR